MIGEADRLNVLKPEVLHLIQDLKMVDLYSSEEEVVVEQVDRLVVS